MNVPDRGFFVFGLFPESNTSSSQMEGSCIGEGEYCGMDAGCCSPGLYHCNGERRCALRIPLPLCSQVGDKTTALCDAGGGPFRKACAPPENSKLPWQCWLPDSFQNENWYRCPEGYTKCSWDLS